MALGRPKLPVEPNSQSSSSADRVLTREELGQPPFELNLNDEPAEQPAVKSLPQRALDKVKNAGSYLKEHPVTAILGTLTSLQPAINAFLAPTNGRPKDITPEWWDSLSGEKKALSIFFFACSLSINFVLAMFFLPKAQADLKNIFTKFNERPVTNGIALFFGFLGAVALGMLAYDAFSAFPIYASATLAVFSFGMNFATRLVSVKGVLDRFSNNISPSEKSKTTRRIARKLSMLKPEHIAGLNQKLAEIAPRIPRNELDPNVVRIFHEELLKGLVNQLHAIMKNDQAKKLFMKDKTCRAALIKNGAFMTHDILLGLSAAAVGYFIFTEKGFAGFRTVETLPFINAEQLALLPQAAKIALGSGSGIASGMLYLVSLYDLRAALSDALAQLGNHPAEIPFALAMLTACLASSVSMFNVATNMINNPKNLFARLTEAAPVLFQAGATLGGFGVNGRATAMRLFSKEPNWRAPTVDDVVEFVEKNGDSLSEDTIDTIANLSMFKTPKPENTETTPLMLESGTHSINR